MTIRKPFAVLPLALTGIETGNAKSNRPASHLALTQYPAMLWESSGASNLWVRGRFLGRSAINFFSLMGANAEPGAKIRLRLGTTQAQVDGVAPYDSGDLPFISPGHIRSDGIYHSHLEIGEEQSATWWRIDISGHAGDFSASAAVFGRKREPDRFYNRDREVGFEDLGGLDISRNGVVSETSGVVLKTLLFRLQWVSDEEFWQTWAPLMEGKGKRQVTYWCFNPEEGVRRQDASLLGYLVRDLFMRGNDFPKDNQMDFQIRALAFPQPPPPIPRTLFAAGEQGAWYDFTDLSTMWADTAATVPATVNNTVARVDDKSGNGNHLIQTNAASRPILRDAGGIISLEFDGTDDGMIRAGFDFGGSDQVSAWMGLKTSLVKSSESWFGLGNTASQDGSFEAFQSSGGVQFRSRGTTRVIAGGAGNATANVPLVFAANAEISPPSITVFNNSTASTTNTTDQGTGTYTQTDFTLGKLVSGTAFPANIFVSQLIVRNVPTTGDLFNDVRSFVAEKAGVTL